MRGQVKFKIEISGRGNVWIVALVVALLIAGPNPIPSLADSPQPGQTSVTQPELAAPGAEPMAPDWWATVQEDLRQAEYNVTWQEQTYLTDIPAAYQAPNRTHNLRTYFAPAGPIVIPRTWAEETRIPPWRWEASLAGWGREGAAAAVPPAALEPQDNSISYRRGASEPEAGLVEWYRNGEEGLEQHVRLVAPPTTGEFAGTAGGSPAAPLQLVLALGGSLAMQPEGDTATEKFLLEAAALRMKMNEEAAEITEILDETAVTRDSPVFERARRTTKLADGYVQRFGHLVDGAMRAGQFPEAQQLQLLRMRLIRDYSGLWLLVSRPFTGA
jgi:hypothetical protein